MILRLTDAPTAPAEGTHVGPSRDEPTAPENATETVGFPDAAQERGEVAVQGQHGAHVPDGNMTATAADVGLSRKDEHEARTAADYLGPARLIRDLSGALRTRLYRRRRAAGKIVVRVTIDEIGASEALIASGWLDPRDQDDPRAIGAALERATIKIMPRVTRHDAAEADQAHSLGNWSEDEDEWKS